MPEHTSEDCLCVLFTSTGSFTPTCHLNSVLGRQHCFCSPLKAPSTVICGRTCSMHKPWVPPAEWPVKCSNWNICLIKSLLISERGECNQMGPIWHATSVLLRWHDIKGKIISIPAVQKVRRKYYVSFSVFSRMMYCITSNSAWSSFHFVPYFLKQIWKIADREANTWEIEASYPNKCYVTDMPLPQKSHSLTIDNIEL